MRFSHLCRQAAGKYNTFKELSNRSLVHQCTDELNLKQTLDRKKCTIYTGFDPTAKSLHVGNLLTIVSLLHFWAGGHRVIALIGGATGEIGDPSGKSKERIALNSSVVSMNSLSIESQLNRVFRNACLYLENRDITITDSDSSSFLTLNNIEWFGNMRMIDFLRLVGRKARVSTMLAKDSVHSRMEGEGEGISFSEFSYQLLQAYDYLHLHSSHACDIQLGGSDQFGNITAGLELIRKSKADCQPNDDQQNPAFGITIPLVTTASGEKFGKSEGNAVWLEPSILSEFEFYQFFRRTPDSEVERLLRLFTFLPTESISKVMAQHKECQQKQLPQRLLASEVTELVHGRKQAKLAETKSAVLYDHCISKFSVSQIEEAFHGDQRLVYLDKSKLEDIVGLTTASGAVKSSSAAFKLIKSGGLYVNNIRWPVGNKRIDESVSLVDGKLLLLRTGKSNYRIVVFS